MKKYLIACSWILTAVCTWAQQTVESKTSDFSKLRLSGNIEVTLIKAEAPAIKAEIIDASSDKFEWQVQNEELSIKLKQVVAIGKDTPKPFAKVLIYYTALSDIYCTGTTLLNEGTLISDVLTITASSKANIAVLVQCRDITVEAANSKVTVNGETEFLTVKANTGSSVNTVTMTCQNANISTATNAECFATAIQRFEAKATTNSNVYYKGAPEIIKKTENSLGKVQSF